MHHINLFQDKCILLQIHWWQGWRRSLTQERGRHDKLKCINATSNITIANFDKLGDYSFIKLHECRTKCRVSKMWCALLFLHLLLSLLLNYRIRRLRCLLLISQLHLLLHEYLLQSKGYLLWTQWRQTIHMGDLSPKLTQWWRIPVITATNNWSVNGFVNEFIDNKLCHVICNPVNFINQQELGLS